MGHATPTIGRKCLLGVAGRGAAGSTDHQRVAPRWLWAARDMLRDQAAVGGGTIDDSGRGRRRPPDPPDAHVPPILPVHAWRVRAPVPA